MNMVSRITISREGEVVNGNHRFNLLRRMWVGYECGHPRIAVIGPITQYGTWCMCFNCGALSNQRERNE